MPGGPGGMPNMPDLNSPEMKAQFDQLGMSPTDVSIITSLPSFRLLPLSPVPGCSLDMKSHHMQFWLVLQIVQKIMGDPELASAFQNPKVCHGT